MKIKIIEENNYKTAEEKVNSFETDNDVRATQSHVTKHNDELVYTFVLYYMEGK